MEALGALNGQTQAQPAKREEAKASRPQPSAKVDTVAKSDNAVTSVGPEKTDKSGEPVSRLAELAKAVADDIQSRVPSNSHLQIVRHDETGTFVYRVLDAETGEIVSQYPADEALRELAFWRDLKGLSVDTST